MSNLLTYFAHLMAQKTQNCAKVCLLGFRWCNRFKGYTPYSKSPYSKLHRLCPNFAQR